MWAYERSCARYSAVRQSLGEPDRFRLQHQEAIIRLIADIVTDCEGKEKAVLVIKNYAANQIDQKYQARFIEVVETELMSLHEGNMARYGIRPSEFSEWQRHWSSEA